MKRSPAATSAASSSRLPRTAGRSILRAPFALATSALGGGELAVFRAVSIPCVLAVAILALVIADRMLRDGRSRGACLLVVALAAANPITIKAFEIGHPEELLCAAALADRRGAGRARERTLLAAVLLGLAIATKAWAVLAIGPVLLALPGRRLLALGVAGTVCAAIVAPLMLAGSGDAVVHGARMTGGIFNPWQIWWPLGELTNIGVDGDFRAGARAAPAVAVAAHAPAHRVRSSSRSRCCTGGAAPARARRRARARAARAAAAAALRAGPVEHRRTTSCRSCSRCWPGRRCVAPRARRC